MNEYNKKEMENQINCDDSDSEIGKEPYELCDHEYTVRLDGVMTCLTCGLQMEDLAQFVPEGGYGYRVMVQKKTVTTNYGWFLEKN